MDKEERFCIDETLKHIRRVQELLADVTHNLNNRGISHDDSKLMAQEFDGFVEFTPKLKGMTYGSDEYKECLEALKPTLDHHYAAQDHHPENKQDGISAMSLMSLMELITDWKSASERHKNGSIKRSIVINQDRFGYSDELKQIMLNTVKEMGW